MIERIKMMFCMHDFEMISSKVVVKDGHYMRVRTKYRCKKCGKVKYRE